MGLSLGEHERALGWFTDASTLYRELGDLHGQARVAAGSAFVHTSLGNAKDAAVLTARAIELFEKVDDRRGLASAYYSLGLIARLEGRYDEAKAHYRRALEIAERHGFRHAQGNAVDGIADIDRLQGDLEAAERGFRQGMAIWESLDSETDTSRINIGLIALTAGKAEETREMLTPVVPSLERRGDKPLLLYCQFALCGAAAQFADAVAFDEHAAAAGSIFEASPVAASDLAEIAETAADRWRARETPCVPRSPMPSRARNAPG